MDNVIIQPGTGDEASADAERATPNRNNRNVEVET